MLRQFTALLIACIVTFLSLIGNVQPVYASPNVSSIQELIPFEQYSKISGAVSLNGVTLDSVTDFITRCLLNTSESGFDEMTCQAVKTGTIFAACYVITQVGDAFIPGTSVFVPLCNSILRYPTLNKKRIPLPFLKK
jgi:hypothetical protein